MNDLVEPSPETPHPEEKPPPEPLVPAIANEFPPESLEFTGVGGEYFRIWIGNVFFSIVTLGVYSAWAKVRRSQYFYRNTRLAGAGFDYHGEPIAILKGRVIGLALFSLYTFSGLVSAWLPLVVGALIGLILPWLLLRSLGFRMANSSYRGLRFGFHGSLREAYWVFLALPLLSVLTLGWVAPFWYQRMKRYQHASSSYGDSRFAFQAPVAEFYFVFLATVAVGVVVGVAIMGAFGAGIAITALAGGSGPAGAPEFLFVTVALAAVVYMSGLILIQAFFGARTLRLVWANTMLHGHKFACAVRTRPLAWILVTNLLGTIVTLGFYRPFGQVRLARYVVGAFALLPEGPLDFVAADRQEVGAAGEETAGFFDFDIAF